MRPPAGPLLDSFVYTVWLADSPEQKQLIKKQGLKKQLQAH